MGISRSTAAATLVCLISTFAGPVHAAAPSVIWATSLKAADIGSAEAVATRRCWWRNGTRHCPGVNAVTPSPYPNDYFYFAPNTFPTARRGWQLGGSPVDHSPPSPH